MVPVVAVIATCVARRLLGTSPMIAKFNSKLNSREIAELSKRQKSSGICMVKRIKKNGKVKVTGCPALKWSASYPQQFCSEVLRHFEDHAVNPSDPRLEIKPQTIYNRTTSHAAPLHPKPLNPKA